MYAGHCKASFIPSYSYANIKEIGFICCLWVLSKYEVKKEGLNFPERKKKKQIEKKVLVKKCKCTKTKCESTYLGI